MKIIYTCPKCGHDLEDLVLESFPPKYEKRCTNCGWNHIENQSDEIIRIPYENVEVSINTAYIPPACRTCSQHPSNGGSGICHCILGTETAYC